MVASATDSNTLVCAMDFHSARVGGRFAFADFHVTPPFGKIIFESSCPSSIEPPPPTLKSDEPVRLAKENQPLDAVGPDACEMLLRRMTGDFSLESSKKLPSDYNDGMTCGAQETKSCVRTM